MSGFADIVKQQRAAAYLAYGGDAAAPNMSPEFLAVVHDGWEKMTKAVKEKAIGNDAFGIFGGGFLGTVAKNSGIVPTGQSAKTNVINAINAGWNAFDTHYMESAFLSTFSDTVINPQRLWADIAAHAVTMDSSGFAPTNGEKGQAVIDKAANDVVQFAKDAANGLSSGLWRALTYGAVALAGVALIVVLK